MNEVFKITLSLSCSGGLLILIFCLIRPLFQSRLSKQWQYYIWLVVVARLLLPIAPHTNFIGSLFQNIDNYMVQTQSVPPLDQEITFEPVSGKVESERNGLQNEPPQNAGGPALWPYWFVIALILFIRKLTIYQSFVNYIKAGCVEVEDINLLEHFGKLVEQSRIKTAVDLYTNNLISSPLLIGFFRPRIILPTDMLSDSEFKYILLHELTHYQKRDMFYKWLVQVTVCVHWFNPLVYLMGREVERTCELSCDEAVIKNLDAQERRAYGYTLLNALVSGGSYKNSSASVTLCEGKKQLKERLDAIADFQKQSKLVFSFTVLLTGAVCFGAAAMGAYAAVPLPALDMVPIAKPAAIGNLTLIEKAYTIEELKALGISNIIVGTLSDDVTVVRGGDRLKFEYYAQNPNEYYFQQVKFNTNQGLTLCFSRTIPSDLKEERSITITIPEHFNLGEFNIRTTSGDISLKNCTAESIAVTTQNGQIELDGSSVSKNLLVDTKIGDAVVSRTVLPDSGKDESYYTNFNTESGTILFQPVDSEEYYCFHIDYGEEAEFIINGEGHEMGYISDSSIAETAENNSSLPFGQDVEPIPGDMLDYLRKSKFTYNEKGVIKVYFNSPKGSFLVQEK